MTSEEHTEDTGAETEESNGGSSNGHNLGRVAAIAAASGATAYAARKALGSRSSSSGQSDDSDDGEPKKKKNSSSESSASLMTAAVASGWDVAKDSLLPVVEDAATKAVAFVADRAPELVRDVVVPRFIAGFQRAKRGDQSESSDSE